MRINARLDEAYSKKLEYIMHKTGVNKSEVIKQAIEIYYNQLTKQQLQANPMDIFRQNGFIGCAEAEENLSATCKRAFSNGLESKNDHR